MYWHMILAQYLKTLSAVLWNIIIFLCPTIALYCLDAGEKLSLFGYKRIYNYFSFILYNLKKFKNKKILKNKNNSTVANLTVSNCIYKNKNSVSNRVNINNTLMNKALKSFKLLHIKKLKDALATQNLISKQHFFRLQDKCAYLYPFCKQKSLQSINL